MAEPEKVLPLPPTASPSFVVTPLLSALISDDKVVIQLAKAGPEIDQLLAQLQLDLAGSDNFETIGPVCRALRIVRDAFSTAISRGEAVLENQKKSKK